MVDKIQSDFYKTWKDDLIDLNITSDTTLTATQEYIGIDTTSGAVTVTLPDTTGVENTKRIWLFDDGGNAGTNFITVLANPSDSSTINGLSSLTVTIDNAVGILELVNNAWTVLNFNNQLTRVTVTADYNVKVNDDVIFGDTTGGAFSIFLPPLVDVQQRPLIIKKVTGASNQLIIDADGTETIESNLTFTLTGSGGPSITLYPENSTNWAII